MIDFIVVDKSDEEKVKALYEQLKNPSRSYGDNFFVRAEFYPEFTEGRVKKVLKPYTVDPSIDTSKLKGKIVKRTGTSGCWGDCELPILKGEFALVVSAKTDGSWETSTFCRNCAMKLFPEYAGKFKEREDKVKK